MKHTPDTARRAALAFLRTRRLWLPSFKLAPLGFWQVLRRGDPKTWPWGPRLVRFAYAAALAFWFFVAARVVLLVGIDPSSVQVLLTGPTKVRTMTWVATVPHTETTAPGNGQPWVRPASAPEFVSLSGILSIAGEEERTYLSPGPSTAGDVYGYPASMLFGWADRALIIDRSRPLFPDAFRAAAIAVAYLFAMGLLPYVLRIAIWSRRGHWSDAPGEELLRRDESLRCASVATTWITTVAAGSAPILLTGGLFVLMAVLPMRAIAATEFWRHLFLGTTIFVVAPIVGAACLFPAPGENRVSRTAAFLCVMLLIIGFTVSTCALGSAIWTTIWKARNA